MEVCIKSGIGSRVYEMTEENVLNLMLTALRISEDAPVEEEEDAHVRPMMDKDRQAEREFEQFKEGIERRLAKQDDAPAAGGAHGSRTERMFGRRETWERRDEPQERPDGWKGFLIIRCPACGDTFSFFSREYRTDVHCKCGLRIDLDDLIPAYVNCGKCGKRLKYRTNIRDDYPVTVERLDCKAPVDMALNSRGTALVPVAQLRMRN